MKKYTKKDALNFLKKNNLMVLSTISKQKTPHTVVVIYFVDKDFNLYFVTHADSTKAQNIFKNKKISSLVWNKDEMSLLFLGTASLVKDKKEQIKIIEKLAKVGVRDDSFWPPVLRIKGEKYAVFKVKPEKIVVLDLRSQNISETEDPFVKWEF